MAPLRSYSNPSVFLVLVVALELLCGASSSSHFGDNVVLRDSGYEGVVVAIEEDLPVSLCQEVLVGLEVSIYKYHIYTLCMQCEV